MDCSQIVFFLFVPVMEKHFCHKGKLVAGFEMNGNDNFSTISLS